jgi:hypothetical protein
MRVTYNNPVDVADVPNGTSAATPPKLSADTSGAEVGGHREVGDRSCGENYQSQLVEHAATSGPREHPGKDSKVGHEHDSKDLD